MRKEKQKKSGQQLGGEAVLKIYGTKHFSKLATDKWKKWRKENKIKMQLSKNGN